MNQSIFLVGPMGAGKTEVGVELAARLGMPFVDTDQLVEERAGASVVEIFEEHGESAFREIEAAVISDAADLPPSVISSGGGSVLREENVESMRGAGVVFYLEVDAKVAAARVQQQEKTRPLIDDSDVEGVLQIIIKEREEAYLQAAHHVVPAHGSVDEVVGMILKEISP